MKRILLLLIVTVLSVAIISCEDLIVFEDIEIEFDNPRDPGGDNFIRPGVQLSASPVYNTESVTLNWTNVPSIPNITIQHRFRVFGEPFDDDPQWSNWQVERAFNRIFDEGEFTLQIQSRYADFPNEATYGDTTFTFRVEAVNEPAIMIRPRRPQTFSRTNEFTVGVWVKNLSEITAADVQVFYNRTQLELVSNQVTSGGFFQDAELLELVNVAPYPQFNNYNIIKKAIALTGANPQGISGEGYIMQLRFRVLPAAPSGQSEIGIAAGSQLRTGSNADQSVPFVGVNKNILIQ